MFSKCKTTTDQGNVGEAAAILWYTCNGFTVSKPLTSNQPYDLVVDNGGLLHRVSVKTSKSTTKSGGYCIGLRTLGGNQSFHTAIKFDNTKLDRVFILCENGWMYDIPSDIIQAQSTITVGTVSSPYETYRVST